MTLSGRIWNDSIVILAYCVLPGTAAFSVLFLPRRRGTHRARRSP